MNEQQNTHEVERIESRERGRERESENDDDDNLDDIMMMIEDDFTLEQYIYLLIIESNRLRNKTHIHRAH